VLSDSLSILRAVLTHALSPAVALKVFLAHPLGAGLAAVLLDWRSRRDCARSLRGGDHDFGGMYVVFDPGIHVADIQMVFDTQRRTFAPRPKKSHVSSERQTTIIMLIMY